MYEIKVLGTTVESFKANVASLNKLFNPVQLPLFPEDVPESEQSIEQKAAKRGRKPNTTSAAAVLASAPAPTPAVSVEKADKSAEKVTAMAEVREALGSLLGEGVHRMEPAHNILQSFGATKISDLKVSDYDDFIAKINAVKTT